MSDKRQYAKIWNVVSTILVGAASYFGLTYRFLNPDVSQAKKNLVTGVGIVGVVATAVNVFLLGMDVEKYKSKEGVESNATKPQNRLNTNSAPPFNQEGCREESWTEFAVRKKQSPTRTIL